MSKQRLVRVEATDGREKMKAEDLLSRELGVKKDYLSKPETMNDPHAQECEA